MRNRVRNWMRARRGDLRADATAGVVLGVQSVPDGLATGLLAGVNPLAGLYAYLVGTVAGATLTSSAFMAVQGTGAMAMIVVDVGAIGNASDPAAALFTLSVLTGVIMVVAGLLRLGSVLRFVSNSVLVGFINAVGVNIVLGQLGNFTGYEAEGANRVVRAVDTVLNPGLLDVPTLVIGAATIALIVLFERTPVGSLGLVLAVVVTSAIAALASWDSVATLSDLGDVPSSLPLPQLPSWDVIPQLLVPAASLAFVGLVQGSAISANFPNPDGRYPDPSRDFLGQGTANVASGLFQGMPVGGSLSATSIVRSAGARSRMSLFVAGATMAVVILVFSRAISFVAMPALAGLLMLIGVRTVSIGDLRSVWGVGLVQKVVVSVTFVLTMLVPLQYAVLSGVALSLVLHAVRQANQITVRRRIVEADGSMVEVDPPAVLPGGEVVVLQPYGSLFFAAAKVFEDALPAVTPDSRHAVVILRLRGRTDLGTTFTDVLHRYAASLAAVDARLVIVSENERIHEQLAVTGVTERIGPDAVYRGTERIGQSVRRAHDDALAWIAVRDDGGRTA